MNAAEEASFSQNEVEVETACGGKVVLADDTPQSIYQGQPMYFCLLECKVKFESDPLTSCLAERLQIHSR